MVICLERGADLHMFQLTPLPLTVSCFSKIQIGFAFLVPAHLGSPRKMAVKRVCVCVNGCVTLSQGGAKRYLCWHKMAYNCHINSLVFIVKMASFLFSCSA